MPVVIKYFLSFSRSQKYDKSERSERVAYFSSQTWGNIFYPIIRQYTTASRVINEYTTGGDQMVSNLLGKKVYACDLK